MPDNSTIEQWVEASGLTWSANVSPMQYAHGKKLVEVDTHRVLHRSDTGHILGVVSPRYKPVQPVEIVEFFRDLTEVAGFSLETVGALYGGRRIWALARTNHSAAIGNAADQVKGYLLLSTTFDGSKATEARYVNIRVVCHNTISMADRGKAGVKVPHSSNFDHKRVKENLGLGATNAFSEFLKQAEALAKKKLNRTQAEEFVTTLLDDPDKKTSGYKKILGLFEGGALGADMAGQTKWGMLSAVTEYVDHHLKNDQNYRLKNAWFGAGDRLKVAALNALI